VDFSYLLDDPMGVHVDVWDSILLATALVFALGGVSIHTWLAQRWAHHPFRVVIQGHMANALLGCAVALALIGASHFLGWPIYGLPVVGMLALMVSVGVVTWLVVDWWSYVRPELTQYETKFPAVKEAHSEVLSGAHKTRSQAPMLWGLSGAFVAYAAFVWHPWPHLFHEGNFVYGAPVGFAIGSLVAMHKSTVPAPTVPPKRLGGRNVAKRRR
jgi:hypothetical protein